jgi:hypothetical protein
MKVIPTFVNDKLISLKYNVKKKEQVQTVPWGYNKK